MMNSDDWWAEADLADSSGDWQRAADARAWAEMLTQSEAEDARIRGLDRVE